MSGMYEGWPARERKLSLSSGHIIGIIIAIICLLIILIAIFVLCLKRINRKEASEVGVVWAGVWGVMWVGVCGVWARVCGVMCVVLCV